MIPVLNGISLDENELHWDFIRSSGPGGQNVNKVATAVQLRFNVRESARLSQDVKKRIRQIAGRRMTADGVLILTARRFRHQEKNREDALERLLVMIRQAASPPKRRIRTVPSHLAREERIHEKKLRGLRKKTRFKQGPHPDE